MGFFKHFLALKVQIRKEKTMKIFAEKFYSKRTPTYCVQFGNILLKKKIPPARYNAGN
jgi:hypothetical protein